MQRGKSRPGARGTGAGPELDFESKESRGALLTVIADGADGAISHSGLTSLYTLIGVGLLVHDGIAILIFLEIVGSVSNAETASNAVGVYIELTGNVILVLFVDFGHNVCKGGFLVALHYFYHFFTECNLFLLQVFIFRYKIGACTREKKKNKE